MSQLPSILRWLPKDAAGQHHRLSRLVRAVIAKRDWITGFIIADRLCALSDPPSVDDRVLRMQMLHKLDFYEVAKAEAEKLLLRDADCLPALEILNRESVSNAPILNTPTKKPIIEPDWSERASKTAASISGKSEPGQILIIVPVFGDADATEACIASVLRANSLRRNVRIIVIDDHSPDPRVSSLVASLHRNGRLQCIRNETNLGFAGSINAGFQHRQHEDVILLNADTIVPPGFVDRLADAAYAHPDIGTVTPLSNNGEYTSIPIRNRENPLPVEADIVRMDHKLAAYFGRDTVDIPNGIGFCLFIKSALAQHLGPLSTDFGRGYYEDVEYCLRARELGFRNVAALGVYVGHAGSRSFGGEKRRLVLRNLQLIETRYPTYRRASSVFLSSDPLKQRLAGFCKENMANLPQFELLVGAPGADLAQRLVPGRSAIMAELDLSCGLVSFRLSSQDMLLVDDLTLRFSLDNDMLELARWPVSMVRLVDPAAMPPAAVAFLLSTKWPYRIEIEDDIGIICPMQAFEQEQCRQCLYCAGSCPTMREGRQFREQASAEDWADVILGAERIETPSMISGLASAVLSDCVPVETGERALSLPIRKAAGDAPGWNIAVFANTKGWIDHELIVTFARLALADSPSTSVILFQPKIHDPRFASVGNIWQVQRPTNAEAPPIEAYGCSVALFGSRRSGMLDPLLPAFLNAGKAALWFGWANDFQRSRSRCVLPIDMAPQEAAQEAWAWLKGYGSLQVSHMTRSLQHVS
jgi:GT2 family glycosyltransferase